MGTWSPALFADDLTCDVRHEYGVLLSLLRDNDEVEEKLCAYYSDILTGNDEDEPNFWFSLAYCEWKRGLLSERAKNKAIQFIDNGRDLDRWTQASESDYNKRKKVLLELQAKLLSPMPPTKKITKKYVTRCPWKAGDLLAYRVASYKGAKETGLFGKYVLLRVVKIKKYGISKIMPTEFYDEGMIVSLYNWCGDDIPNPDIVERLEYIPIIDYESKRLNVDLSGLNNFDRESAEKMASILTEYARPKRVVKYCVDLQWKPIRDEVQDITCIGHDSTFENNLPDFLDTSTTGCSLIGLTSLDIKISNHKDRGRFSVFG